MPDTTFTVIITVDGPAREAYATLCAVLSPAVIAGTLDYTTDRYAQTDERGFLEAEGDTADLYGD